MHGSRLISRAGSTTTLYLGHTELTLTKGAAKAKATRCTPLGGGHTTKSPNRTDHSSAISPVTK
ncbi:hypothetical protein GCM10023100_25840 [Actinocorallia cavernae]|uniref:Uncharacterized protein n=2 Tax=Actinomycetes TaxID=1760 RepID=A0ABN3LX20_9ACTN